MKNKVQCCPGWLMFVGGYRAKVILGGWLVSGFLDRVRIFCTVCSVDALGANIQFSLRRSSPYLSIYLCGS